MTIYKLDVEIQGLPKRINESLRGSWKAKASEARKWQKIVWQHTLGKKPSKPLPRASLTLTRYSSVQPDFDGLVSSFKHPIDGLITAGILLGDKMSHIGAPVYRWERVSPGKGKIRIQIEQID